jgi:hypothetical protein
MTHLPDSPPREAVRPNLFISPRESPSSPCSGNSPSFSTSQLSPDQETQQMDSDSRDLEVSSQYIDSCNKAEDQEVAINESPTELLPVAASMVVGSDLFVQNTELPLWEKVTQESDAIRNELIKYLNELQEKTDENGIKLVTFPSNYNQIVSLMTSDDLKGSSDAICGGQNKKKKKKKTYKATDLAAHITGTSWSQVLFQTALEKEDSYGSLKSFENGRIGASGDRNEKEQEQENKDSSEEKLQKKIALGLAKIRENDLILEKLKTLTIAATSVATTTDKKKKKIFKAPEETEESTIVCLDKKMDQKQPTNKCKSLTSKHLKSLNHTNSSNSDVNNSNRLRISMAPSQEEEETKRLKTFVTELHVKSPRSSDMEHDDTKSMKSSTSSKVSKATRGSIATSATTTGLTQKTFVERNRELVENGAKKLTKEEEDRVNVLLEEDDQEINEKQGQEDDNKIHSGSFEQLYQYKQALRRPFASSAFVPAETEKLRDQELDQLLQTLHTRMAATTPRPFSSSGYFSVEIPEEMFISDLKVSNSVTGRNTTRTTTPCQSSKALNIVTTVANELQDARIERLKLKRLEEIEQRLMLLKMEQEDEMVLLRINQTKDDLDTHDEGTEDDDQQSVASFKTRTSISSTRSSCITRQQMNALVSEAQKELFFLQGQEQIQTASKEEIKQLLATLPSQNINKNAPEIIQTLR